MGKDAAGLTRYNYTMDQRQLREFVAAAAEELQVPGVAVGVHHGGDELYAFHGVTNVEAPVAVDEDTLFQYGSTHKTFTATAIMRLVDRGLVDLDAPVRTYVPELKLRDPEVAERVTVLQILNHTAGWSGDAHEDTGDGDDARERFVASMASLEQTTPLGATVSYNNAAFNLAGHLIEKVTGKVYETAMRELIHEPLGLKHSFFFPTEVISRRFAVGHNQDPDGTIKVARPWALARASAPAGGFGVTATAADQIAWARFHLGDGTAPDGTKLMSRELLDRMKQPTAQMPGSALGDAVGIAWLLRSFGGLTLVSHGGTTIGQLSQFMLVPERDFALISMTNCSPNGSHFNDQLRTWALETAFGVTEPDPEPIEADAQTLAAYAGRYETIAAIANITAADGGLVLQVEIKPEMRRQLQESGEDVPDQPPLHLGLLAGEGDRYVITDGPAKGMRGYFVRGASGAVDGVHVGGRLASRVADVAERTTVASEG